MAPPFPRASIALDYPLYALEFDPEDANRLVVGGGGGAGRSGVGNKISVLETTTMNDLRVAGELELSRDEDSVMSLAIGPHKGKTTYIYAGVNSSHDSIAKGKNESLRTLGIEQSKSRSSAGTKGTEIKIAEVSRSLLFSDPQPDTYQRLLRVAGPMGVAATAMGKEPQLAVFETATSKLKGVMELPKEAEDLDIVQKSDSEFQVAFCYKYELHIVNIGKESSDPELIYTMPENDPERPQFRSIRYITADFIIAVSNLPKRAGVLIQGLRLPTAGHPLARVSVNVRIPRKISATAMAVTNLSPPASLTSPVGETQFIVAIAGHDSSISLYTLSHRTGAAIPLLVDLWHLHTLKDVHGTDNITGVDFSTFVTPKTHIRQQYIKLASISLQKNVSVHSIPLRKNIEKAPRNRNAPPRPVRYVVAMKSHGMSNRPLAITLGVLFLLIAVIGQSILEMYGNSRPILHVQQLLPSWHRTLRSPDYQPQAFLNKEFLSNLGADKTLQPGETLVVWQDDATPTAAADADSEDGSPKIQLDVHDEDAHGPAKPWDELGEKQQQAWKEKLKEAGTWTHNMGESVFQGILFGEMAGAVGRAVAG
ncbi:hypothetical protein G7046_g6723 [Stylonectria norvegica]|nr:hypothetical protein G7046_g6723 [Stylonectria norvegica]